MYVSAILCFGGCFIFTTFYFLTYRGIRRTETSVRRKEKLEIVKINLIYPK